jgi:hypothetical protein
MWHLIGLRAAPTRLSWHLKPSHFPLQFRVRLFQSTDLLFQRACSGNRLLKLRLSLLQLFAERRKRI